MESIRKEIFRKRITALRRKEFAGEVSLQQQAVWQSMLDAVNGFIEEAPGDTILSMFVKKLVPYTLRDRDLKNKFDALPADQREAMGEAFLTTFSAKETEDEIVAEQKENTKNEPLEGEEFAEGMHLKNHLMDKRKKENDESHRQSRNNEFFLR